MTRKLSNAIDAVAELKTLPTISRADLIRVADKHNAPFKTVVEFLEESKIIPAGTYREIMWRFGTLQKFREVVAERDNHAD